MDVLVEMAIDLACQLQEDPRCVAVREAQEAADKDEELQNLIGEFNLKRLAVNNEELKPEEKQDGERTRKLNEELRTAYAAVMANEHMQAYQQAKEELDALTGKINTAIALAVQGQDPNLARQDISCTGDCSSCGGCH